jgi:hypothetical protein
MTSWPWQIHAAQSQAQSRCRGKTLGHFQRARCSDSLHRNDVERGWIPFSFVSVGGRSLIDKINPESALGDLVADIRRRSIGYRLTCGDV